MSSNPGNFDLLHKEVRDVFTTNHFIEGAKVEVTKPLSQPFQVLHRFLMGPQNEYNFGATFAHNKGFLHGEIDSAGNLSSRVHQNLTDNLALKFNAQLTKRGNSVILDTEYAGHDFTANAKAVNLDVTSGKGVFILDYIQSVTPKLALGVETLIHNSPAALDSGLTFVSRYNGNNYVATANVATNGSLQATYYHKVSEQLSIGSELEVICNSRQRESNMSAGMKFDFRQATFRCMADSQGKVSAVLEEKVVPGVSFVFSGELDHYNSQSRFGLGLVLGGS